MKCATILVVDDEPQIRRVMRATLSSSGYTILDATSGEEALEIVRGEPVDLVLLDVNMPGMDGVETCREIRAASDIPIITVTVRDAERDKVRALDAGADDYIVKPFGIQELLARIRAALRRHAPDEAACTVISKDLVCDFERRSIQVRGKVVHLTPKEFDLLRELVLNHDKPVRHRRLLQAVWGPDYGDETEYLRVVVNQLRKKIESDPRQPKFIQTEPSFGYRFVLPEDARTRGRNEDTSVRST
jgi:two-component system, OmpR family, KDP operon response regulator KdpE